jgi:hypothetical protein
MGAKLTYAWRMRGAPVALLLALVAVGCGGPAAPPEGPRPAAADRSLSVAEYITRGVPAPDRPWGPAQYAAALAALERVAAQHPAVLPRAGSPASGALFERIASLDNLAALDPPGRPPQERWQALSELGPPVTGLLRLYLQVHHRGVRSGAEIAGLEILLLAYVGRVYTTVDALSAVAPPTGPLRTRVDRGLAQMAKGLTRLVGGAITSAADRQNFDEADRIRLAEALGRELPGLFGRLSSPAQYEITTRLRQAIAAEPSPAVRTALHAVAAALPPPS